MTGALLALMILGGAPATAGENPNAHEIFLEGLEGTRYTRETLVEIDGVKYRKIEVNGKTYYLKILWGDDTPEDPLLYCERNPLWKGKEQIELKTQVVQRTGLFIDGLRTNCEKSKEGVVRPVLDTTLRVGFYIKDKKGDYIKNKKVILFPFFGIAGEW